MAYAWILAVAYNIDASALSPLPLTVVLRCLCMHVTPALLPKAQALSHFYDDFCAATRRYASDQLKWFRSPKGAHATFDQCRVAT
jgi:tRNA A37 N6-isopentenylltransferase MiaA